MDRIEYKEGILICGGNRASEQLENVVCPIRSKRKRHKRNVRFDKSIFAIL